MRKKRTGKNYVIFSAVNACVMLLISFFLMQSSYVNGDERLLISSLAQFRSVFLGVEAKPSRDSVIFIDVAYDVQLVEKTDADGFVLGQEAITDREKLTHFLHILSQRPDNQKAILCDIFFQDSLKSNAGIATDSLLGATLRTLKNVILPMHSDGDTLLKPIFPAPAYLADFRTVDGSFYKFKLYNDHIKTVPLGVYEAMHNSASSYNGIVVSVGDVTFLNSVIPPMYVRQYDLFNASVDERYKVDNLTNMLSGAMSDHDILEYVKGRIVVIGDLSNRDIHQSASGAISGSLILFNTYLMLERGDNQITWRVVAFLLAGYFAVTLLMFYAEAFINRFRSKLNSRIANLVPELLSAGLLLLFLSCLCYLIFGVSVSILYLSFYMVALKWLSEKIFETAVGTISTIGH